MRILVTGGCGFIGSALVRRLVGDGHRVLNLDKLTYAGNPATVADVANNGHYAFMQGDICDAEAVSRAFADIRPTLVFHLAAESHVDRSIDGPSVFVETNIRGTYVLLAAAIEHWRSLAPEEKGDFRFVHVSTDEVYGSLGPTGFFTEVSPYAPNSPYAASKAGSDHLASAWFTTFGLPTLVTSCSNNYGPFQHREKLIPTIVRKALAGQPIPIYGRGENVRDWLYVEDHIAALITIGMRGAAGEKYNIGSRNEVKNIEIARMLCDRLDEIKPLANGRSYADQITFVTDRPGHDYRYAIDPHKLESQLGWRPLETFKSGIAKTVSWQLANLPWMIGEASPDDRLGLKNGG